MELAKETAKERRGGPASVSNVLLGSGVGGVTLWGGDLVFVSGNVQESGGVHMGFLGDFTGEKSMRQRDWTWRIVAAVRIIDEAGTTSLGTYIDKSQTTVAE